MTKSELLKVAQSASGNCAICHAADFCPYFNGDGADALCHQSQPEPAKKVGGVTRVKTV